MSNTDIPREIKAIHFGILSPEEITKYSVLEIISAEVQFEGTDGQGGLFDPRLGVVNKGEKCKTCRLDAELCPGHFGHINLASPMFKQEYTKNIKLMLETTCIKCGQFIIKKENVKSATTGLIGKDALDRIKALIPTTTKIRQCINCMTIQPKIRTRPKELFTIEYTYSHIKNTDLEGVEAGEFIPELGDKVKNEFVPYPNDQIYNRLKQFTNETIKIFGLDPHHARPEWMMWTALPVAPPVVRPNTLSDGTHKYDDFTHIYMDIIIGNNKLRDYIEHGKEFQTHLETLNIEIAAITFNTIHPITHKQTRKPLMSIKSRLDGKDGLFRKNLIAKRVNFSGRSVVSAGPHTPIHHLGVPKKIAMNLTVPIKATKFNIHELQQAIINGPNIYPGANYISSGGNVRNLRVGNRTEIVVNIGDEVGLHIREGDPVLFNRQPTLWRPSIMCHMANIVPHYTFRLNLSSTTPYNADFDGDEMNLHLPQSEATLAESKFLMAAHKHIISSQTSSTMIGIQQDSLLGMGLFTRSDVKFDKILAGELAIWGKKFDEIDLSSKDIWNSREIVSLILPAINMSTFSNVKNSEKFSQEDKEVKIIDGNLISGIIDKTTIGEGSKGIIQIVWRDYGPNATADLITNIQEISAHYLLNRGFSISIGDMIVSADAVKSAKDVIKQKFLEVDALLAKIDSGQYITPVDVTVEDYFDLQAKIILGSSLAEQAGKIPYAEINTPTNAIATMVSAGSNGSVTYAIEIIALVGQTIIEGKRAQAFYGKRTLPFFHMSEMTPISRGFVYHSLLEGYNVIEAFFIAQFGREGTTSTAIKTASAGYLARRMTKMSERLHIEYNYMVRSGNEIIQLIYPFDSWYIENQKLEHIKISMEQFDKIYKHSKANTSKKTTDEYNQVLDDRKFCHKLFKNTRIDDSFAFPFNMRRIVMNGLVYEKTNQRNKMTEKDIDFVIDKINGLCISLGKNFMNDGVKDEDVPIRFQEVCKLPTILIRSALNSKRVIFEYKLSKSTLKFIINEVMRQFAAAIIAPKEMVGYISAQSLSEIATQDTIDAFHAVGATKGAKKKKSGGMARMTEILNFRKDIKEPIVTIPLVESKRDQKSEAVRLKNKIEYISLRLFVRKTEIIYDPDPMNPIVYDNKLVAQYFKYTPKEKERIPSNVSPYMIRITLNRQKVYQKQIDMLVFKLKLESFSQACYVITSDINDDELIIRVHIDVDAIIDYSPEFELRHIEKTLEYIIHDLYVRGIKGLVNINIAENVIEQSQENGEIKEVKEYILEADGNNISGIAGLSDDAIDKVRLETNDLYMIYRKYGIEATRKIMLRDIAAILRDTKSDVSYMHIRLLVDNMTYGGTIMPLNRHGFKRRNPGALIRMAFEQNTMQITKAAMHSEIDILKNSPTGSVIFGQNLPCGTGTMVDIHMDETKIGIQSDDLDDIF